MKKLLILGAGVYQVPLIRKAQEMGLYTIVTSMPGKYPGFAIADKAYYVDTTDLEAVRRIAEEEKIDGVITAGTDVCVPTQGYLCDTLGLRGPSLEAAEKAQSKRLMKQAFREYGVNTAPFVSVPLENEDPREICEKIGYPVIVKSIDSSGSRGITRVDGPEDLPFAYSEMKANTRADSYLIEKFLVGEEFGAQAFVYGGKIRFILPHGDYVFQGSTGVPIGHFAPYEVSEKILEESREQLQKAVEALGIDNCAVNTDFILCDGVPYVLEIGARTGATCLVEMTEQYFGIDYYRQIIRCSMGEEPDFTPGNEKRQPCVVMLLRSEKSGVITSVDLGEQTDPRVLDLSMDYAEGDEIRAFRKGPDRIGQCVVIADSVEEGKKVLDEALAKVRITLKEEA